MKLRFGDQLTRLEIVLLFGLIFGGFLLSIYLIPAFAQNITTVEPEPEPINIAPDSPFYGLDVALDNLVLLLQLSEEDRANIGLLIAKERLDEIEDMIDKDDIDNADEARKEHQKVMLVVGDSVLKIKTKTSEDDLRQVIEIERRLIDHDQEVTDLNSRLKIKIETRGTLNLEQKSIIDNILLGLDQDTTKVKIKIDTEKGRIKIEIKGGGMSEIDIQQLEKQFGQEVEIKIKNENGRDD